ncbi:MAG TPA: DUF5666 domain-containing protein [Thermoanaerobaculia bacterium]|nr:DUF5666 domain-containing protein [Thermoanaerobaculia bacterium]
MSSSSSPGKATISGTLLAAGDGPAGGSPGAGQPLANVTVRVPSTGQTAQTDASGNFTLAGVSPGAVALEIRGAGVQASATVNASPAAVTRVTVTVSRARSTVSLVPRGGVEGIVDRIPTATSFVVKSSRGMVTVRTDAATNFRMDGASIGFGNLRVGQRVEVEGSPQPDGSLLAARVGVEHPEQEENTRTPTMTGTPPTATPTKTPRPDDDDDKTRTPNATPTATVTGGSVSSPTPTRTPEAEEGVEREGTVSSIVGTSFAIMTRSGAVTVRTNSATRFRRDGEPASFADITMGGEVDAEGALQTDGSLLASRVSIKGH